MIETQSITGIIREIVRREMEDVFTLELGVVTAVFSHAGENDKQNYQCSVRLKNRKQANGNDFELRQVAVATPHLGLVNIPNVGDLVVVSFLNKDINGPIIIGRMYHEQSRPPLNQEKEFLLKHHTDTETYIKIASDGGVIIAQGEKNKIEIDKDGNIKLEAEGKIIINDGSEGAAREGDEVEVEIPANSFAVAIVSQSADTLNPLKVIAKGEIISSSGSVLIG